MKTIIFSVSYWGNETPKDLHEWKRRIDTFIPHDKLYLCAGSQSDPTKVPSDFNVVQIGIENTKPYSRDWSYYYVGFLTGLWNTLLNHNDFDLLIHVQNRTFIGQDMRSAISEFMWSDSLLAAPKFTSQIGTSIETGFMMLKPEAVKRYVTSNLRPALSNRSQMNVEEEAYYLFWDSWFQLFSYIPTIRKRDSTWDNKSSIFDLSESDFLELPIIAGPHHCTREELNKWLEKHPISA